MGLKTTPHKEDHLQADDPAKVRTAIKAVEKAAAHVAETQELIKLAEEYDLRLILDFYVNEKKLEEADAINKAGIQYQVMWLIGAGMPLCRLRDILNDSMQVELKLREEAERNR